ncbi:BTB/POZ domain-containing protein 6-A-like [Epargyreus clarus]|uniref:BTB/POZ domain-containing protein 6-A-like n=1 Tax=Epargyreus clarus TaxID=520877 RepID=UPI003C300FD3
MGYKMSDIKCNSLYDRVNKLLVSYEWSDCSFSVSGKKFKAHKLILGISSPVFEAMFYGPLSSSDDISITDIEPEIFQLLLNYIYTDKVEITSIDEAYELLYVSRKYLLENLTEICISYIQSNMTVDNIVTILNYPDYMQDNKLLTSSLKLFCIHANYVLQENLKNISISCMQKILQCDNMNIIEKNLIKYVFEWTSYQCEKSSNSEVKRNILVQNGLLKLLRFAALSLDDLNEIVDDKNNLLMPSDVDTIRHNILDINSTKNLKDYLATTNMSRRAIKLQWTLCHRSPLRSMSPAIIDKFNYYIQARIRVNKPVFINTLRVPSRMAPEVNFYRNATNVYCEQFTVSVAGEHDNSITKTISIKKDIEYDSHFDVEFLQPLFIEKDQWYKINFVWPRSDADYSYAIQSREQTYNNGKIVFEFEDMLSTGDSSGSFLKGLTFCM